MKLPLLNPLSKLESAKGIFNGINNENGLWDAKNLVFGNECHTRNSRQGVMLYSTPPDQIIPCENQLFFRYGNTLKEIIKASDGTLTESGTEYTLDYSDATADRKIIRWEDRLYVFPDNVSIGEDTWIRFAENVALGVSLPFKNARTFFYTSGYSGGETCNDAELLKAGVKLRFSWVPSKIFTVITVENLYYTLDDGSSINEGKRVTLDADVTGYNTVPQGSKIYYCNPQNRPILNSLSVGYNHTLRFSGTRLSISDTKNVAYTLNLNEFFKIGQTVKISGCSVQRNNTTAKITNITESSLYLDCDFTSVTEADKTVITVTPIIPSFSHILLTEDRLFGVDNTTRTFHISALKNPFLFYDNPKLVEDAWSVKLNEKATAIDLWKDNVICFTESGGFRILGYTALNFGVRQLSLNGIKNGCSDSLIRVGDTLYYCSKKGIMKYSGGSDKKISEQVGEIANIKKSITDGVFVYMLADDRIWVFDTDSEIWWSENAEKVLDIFNFNGERYLSTDQAVYLADGTNGTSVDWSFELHLLPDNQCKRVQPLYFVFNHSENTDCIFTLHFKAYGETEWKVCGVYPVKNEGTLKIPLCKCYCSGFHIKVTGNGAVSPESWMAYYRRIDR